MPEHAKKGHLGKRVKSRMEAVDEASGYGSDKEYDEEFDEVVTEMVKKKRLQKLKAEYKSLKSKEEKLENLKKQNKLQVELGDYDD